MAINPISTPNPQGNNGGRFYSFANRPVMVECQFQVSAADTGGLGISTAAGAGLAGQGVNTVFMYTSQTAGVGPNGVTNPLAQSASQGLIIVQLANNYKNILSSSAQIVSPNTGSNLNVDASDAALTVGVAYVITALGTSTTADWIALGVPLGVTPAVGVVFIALVTGSGTGTGHVKACGVSGITSLEWLGQPKLSSWPIPTAGISPNVGATLIGQFTAPTSAAPTLTMNSYTPAGTNAAVTIPVTSGTAGNAVTLNAGTTLEATGGGTVTGSAPAFTGTPAVLTGTITAPATTLAIKQPTDGAMVFLSLYLAR